MATTLKTKTQQATHRQTARKAAQGKPNPASDKTTDAVDLLKADHRQVEEWFDDYADATENAEKRMLATKICAALTVHTQIEEELFYPAAREATKDNDLLDEAVVEHAAAKQLIAEIEAMKPGDDLYDAKVKVLSEQIKHHVKEEEEELFPEVRSTKLNLVELGQQLAQRKAALTKEATAKAAE